MPRGLHGSTDCRSSTTSETRTFPALMFLYRVVFEQSLITGALGFAAGAGLTLLVAPFAQDAVPQFVVFVRWQDILGVAGVTLLMALVAAYIPIRRMGSIDPVTVFKG